MIKDSRHSSGARSAHTIVNICRYCNQEIDPSEEAVKTFSYWSKLEFVCHRQCKQPGELQEAIDCQTIDADCNDCKHYKRGYLAPMMIGLVRREDGTAYWATHQPNIFIDGHCSRFNKTVLAQPNKWTGLECFEHRRS